MKTYPQKKTKFLLIPILILLLSLQKILTQITDFTLKGHTEAIISLLQLKDGRLASSSKSQIRIWNLNTQKTELTFSGHLDWVVKIINLRDGRMASASCDKTIRIWDLKTQKTDMILNEHTECVQDITELQDGRIASASQDNTIRIWNLTTQKSEAVLSGHENYVLSVIQLKDGRIASGSADKTIRIWNLATNKTEKTLSEHSDVIFTLIELADRRLVSCSVDKTIRVWSLNSYATDFKLLGHSDSVRRIIELKDGRLVSSSEDKTILVWNLKLQESEFTFTGHTKTVGPLVQLADGRLASGSFDNEIRIWDFPKVANCVEGEYAQERKVYICAKCVADFTLKENACLAKDQEKIEECQKLQIANCALKALDSITKKCTCIECESGFLLSENLCFSKDDYDPTVCQKKVISNCKSKIFNKNTKECVCAECENDFIISENPAACEEIVFNKCAKQNKILDCKTFGYSKASGNCFCEECFPSFNYTLNACVDLQASLNDTNYVACLNKAIPNCKSSGKVFDKKTKECFCQECKDNFSLVNNNCEDFEKTNKCVYLQGKSQREIAEYYCLTSLNTLRFRYINNCNDDKAKDLPSDTKNFYVFSQLYSPDYIYLGLFDSVKASEFLNCKDPAIYAYHFLNITECDMFVNNLNFLLDKISEMDNIKQKNSLRLDLLEGYIKNCNKEVNFTNSDRLKQLCIEGNNNMVNFDKQKCSSNKFCSDQDYENIITTNANFTKCFLCQENFFYVEKLKDCFVGFIKDNKSRDLWEIGLIFVAGVFLLPIGILFVMKTFAKEKEKKENYRFYIASLINILDILLDIAFLLSALYQFSIYKWINLGIFLFHPTFFYLFGFYYFLKKHRENDTCCNFMFKLMFFPILFCIFSLLGIFGSPNKIFRENEILEYYIKIDLNNPTERKKFKVKMKIVDLMCETLPEICLKIVVNNSSDNWGYFQIVSLAVSLLNLLYCSYVILIEFVEIEVLLRKVEDKIQDQNEETRALGRN